MRGVPPKQSSATTAPRTKSLLLGLMQPTPGQKWLYVGGSRPLFFVRPTTNALRPRGAISFGCTAVGPVHPLATCRGLALRCVRRSFGGSRRPQSAACSPTNHRGTQCHPRSPPLRTDAPITTIRDRGPAAPRTWPQERPRPAHPTTSLATAHFPGTPQAWPQPESQRPLERA